MVEVKERVSRLEEAIEEFVRVVGDAQRKTEEELQKFKESVGIEFNKLYNSQMRTELELRDFKNEMNKRMGELARKLGTIAEDIVAPGIPYAIKKAFGLDVTEVSVRRRKRINGKEREYDVIAVAGNYVFLIDVKSTYRKGYLEEFEELKGDFFKYFSEYKGLKEVPVIASFNFTDEVVKSATKKGWLAVQLGGDYLEFINKDKVKLP